MPIVAKCKSCGREFQIQGIAFANNDTLKTAHTTKNNTEERCSHCSYITTYSMNELIKKD
jgi:DNA-directed RNA polymerase subunit RPC12/RpoP